MTDLLLGVDGARIGWVVAVARPTGGLVDVLLTEDLPDVVGQLRPAVVAIDMPLVLEDAPTRAADDEARALLGPRRSSVFAAPPLGSFGLDDHAAANAWSRRAHGRGISRQAWNLVPRIRAARDLVAATAGTGTAVVEAHPELAFAELAGAPLDHHKATWSGLSRRLDLLEAAGLRPPPDPGGAGRAGADDVLDAAVLTWVARRVRDGTARSVPAGVDPVATCRPGAHAAICW